MSDESVRPDASEVRAILEVVEQLDIEHERLRQRLLEVMEWTEEAVSASVRHEREAEMWRHQAANLQAELDAIQSSRRWRLASTLSAASGRGSDDESPMVADAPGTSSEESTPIFIPVRDRVTPLRRLLEWLERAGHREIWLIDNASTYPPLLEFLESTTHRVVRLERNLGHRSPFLSGCVQRHAAGRFFVISDPDVIPTEDCPLDAVAHFRGLLDRHPEIDKVGFGLRIDDLPPSYPLADDVRAWEARFWTNQIEPGVFRADIDTTFALYRPLDRRHREDLALRTGAPYLARHTPWYIDSNELSDEDRWYRQHAESSTLNWDRDELPRWKRRWIDQSTPGVPGEATNT